MENNLEMIYGNETKAEIEKELKSCQTCDSYPDKFKCLSCQDLSQWEPAPKTVIFTGCSEHQRQFGNCDDPNGECVIGEKYIIEQKEVHSWHTKIKLQGIGGWFNSVCFEDYESPSSRMGDGYQTKEAAYSINKTEVSSIQGGEGAKVESRTPPSKTYYHCICSVCSKQDDADCKLNKALNNLSAQHAELLERYEELLKRFVEETER